MHLIFSENKDVSTNAIIDWLIFKNEDYIRYNGKITAQEEGFDFTNKTYSISIDNNRDSSIQIKSSLSSSNKFLEKVTSLLFRRPAGFLNQLYTPLKNDLNSIPKKEINKNLYYHFLESKNVIINFLENKAGKILGNYRKTGLNKPNTLQLAKECGLDIPNTLITNSKEGLLIFFALNKKKIITKALYEAFSHAIPKKYWISNKTVLIESMLKLPDEFAPSLFQEYIDKEYELRIFYLDGDFFSSAIFSQKNKKTGIDYRNYDEENPNRIVPYNLTEKIKDKLVKLMDKVGLNSGSIDLIKSIDGRYVFLEINPVGQYGFISEPCNFNLEMEICNYLVNES